MASKVKHSKKANEKTEKNSKVNEKKDSKIKKDDSTSKKVKKSEDRQLLMFILVVGMVFAGFLIPYFYIESSKFFEYARADWAIEEYDTFTAYHVKFQVLNGLNKKHNVWLRNDPRELDVPVEGNFSFFKVGGIISFDESTAACVGDLSRAVLDLSGFVQYGIGTGDVEVATTSRFVSLDDGIRHATCENVRDKTLVILQEGETSVIQDEENPYCYTISVENCDDILGIEAFMVKTLEDSLPLILGDA